MSACSLINRTLWGRTLSSWKMGFGLRIWRYGIAIRCRISYEYLCNESDSIAVSGISDSWLNQTFLHMFRLQCPTAGGSDGEGSSWPAFRQVFHGRNLSFSEGSIGRHPQRHSTSCTNDPQYVPDRLHLAERFSHLCGYRLGAAACGRACGGWRPAGRLQPDPAPSWRSHRRVYPRSSQADRSQPCMHPQSSPPDSSLAKTS